jgi:hypothetical protein
LLHRKTNNSNGAVAINPFGTKTMKRLSLEELKAQKVNVVANLDAIKGGNLETCHDGKCIKPLPPIKIITPGDVRRF